ncbi:MAG: glyoxalase [Verrucomicrobia bacterium]|nr:glyoxalase [Verrucomicrobiota bacterium]
MHSIFTGTELCRPFLPTREFELSKRFYEALGFEKIFDGEVAIFQAGSGGFILQRYFQEEWAHNFMMQLMVDDLNAWWTHIQSLELAKNYGVTEPKAPAWQPWGLRVSYVVDPAGVLWHFAEHNRNTPHKE